MNHEIERAAAKWPEVRIVDLDAAFAGHPEWHLDDGIHFNQAGAQQFAALPVRSLAS